ncbi:MAG: hypothetical protein ACYC9Y_15230 [Candidatus Methylomirabilia bacterium]
MIDTMTRGRSVTLALALTAALGFAPGVGQSGPAHAAERVGGDFAIERVDLRFVGGAKVKVLAAGQQVRAEAEITFKGTGQLGGEWEIAGPTTTSGSPQFRTLELVSNLLGMGRHETITSPPLPTATTGAYLLRLRIKSPEIAGQPLVLRYFVGPPASAAAGPAGTRVAIAARGPAAGSPADALKFTWQPVAGSSAYQLEIYEKDGTPARGEAAPRDGSAALLVVSPAPERQPVAGVIVPASETEVAAARAYGEKLAAGKAYVWRVVAIGAEGRLLGESVLQDVVR